MPTSQMTVHGETAGAEGAVTCGVTVACAAGRAGRGAAAVACDPAGICRAKSV